MCNNQRALYSKVRIENDGRTHVYYSFSPTRFKFWLSIFVLAGTLAAMAFAARRGAYDAVEEFVRTQCGVYLAEFHDQVRPRLTAARKDDIAQAIASHTLETSAEYAATSYQVQMEQAKAITDIRLDVATIIATQAERKIAEDAQTMMLRELMRRGE